MRDALSALQRRLQETSPLMTACRAVLAIVLALVAAWSGRRAVIAWYVYEIARPVTATVTHVRPVVDEDRTYTVYRFGQTEFCDVAATHGGRLARLLGADAPEVRGLVAGDQVTLWRAGRYETPVRRRPIVLTVVPALFVVGALLAAIRVRPRRQLFEYIERCILRGAPVVPPGWTETRDALVCRKRPVLVMGAATIGCAAVTLAMYGLVASRLYCELAARLVLAGSLHFMMVCSLLIVLAALHKPSVTVPRVSITRGVLSVRWGQVVLELFDRDGARVRTMRGDVVPIWVASVLSADSIPIDYRHPIAYAMSSARRAAAK